MDTLSKLVPVSYEVEVLSTPTAERCNIIGTHFYLSLSYSSLALVDSATSYVLYRWHLSDIREFRYMAQTSTISFHIVTGSIAGQLIFKCEHAADIAKVVRHIYDYLHGGRTKTSADYDYITFDNIKFDSDVKEGKGTQFKVRVLESDLAKQCDLHGKHYIYLRQYDISLSKEKKSPTLLYSWPLAFIRKVGYHKEAGTFSVEVGRRCASGEGQLLFHTKKAEWIYQTLKKRMFTLKDQQDSDV